MTVDVQKELKIMHACELGAVGVYRGHKCVARYFFRRTLNDLDHMRSHEINHADVFLKLIKDRNFTPCRASSLFFWGGLFYGVFIGFFGLKAIGTSTHTIESIVNEELYHSMAQLNGEQEILAILKEVQQDELAHQNTGATIAAKPHFWQKIVTVIAHKSAYAAKRLASVL